MTRLLACACVAGTIAAAVVAPPAADPARPAAVRHHEPSHGWTALVPAGWPSVPVPGQFVRGATTTDPTTLVLWTYRGRTAAEALRAIAATGGLVVDARTGERVTRRLRWIRFRGHARSDRELAVELATARDGTDVHLAALAAERHDAPRLVETVLLPALDSFVPGPPSARTSVLARHPPAPSYWPTAGWRSAAPAAQGMDAARLDAMVRTIRAQKLPIDSVTVVRHGFVVLDTAFGPFAAGRLGEPYAAGRLHHLHSATKSITSALLGIALHDAAAAGVSADTHLLRLVAPYRPAGTDARKRAITVEHLLTMQSGIAWREWGNAYREGAGNDLVAMLDSPNWTRWVLDRPMAAAPGASFVYNSGASHVLSALTGIVGGRPAADLAETRLFGPLGITRFEWGRSPEGVTDGWGNLLLRPRDLAKIALLYLHHGSWEGRSIVPPAWVTRSTTDLVGDPTWEYGYQWWLDRADGYAYMSGRFGQLAVVAPRLDLVAVVTAHLPESRASTSQWLVEKFVLPSAR